MLEFSATTFENWRKPLTPATTVEPLLTIVTAKGLRPIRTAIIRAARLGINWLLNSAKRWQVVESKHRVGEIYCSGRDYTTIK